jgi:DNA-binding PadR family transcriptional regulator
MKNSKTTFVILGLLTIEPLSGYNIKKLIHESIGHFWSESNGQLYPTLNKLLNENCIRLEQRQQKGKKESLVYSITKEGQRTLGKWLEATTEGKSTHRDEELLKLFFGTNSSSEACIHLLQLREKRAKEKLDQFLAIQKRLEKSTSSLHYLYWNLSLKNGLCHLKAELEWCHEAIQTLKGSI